MAQSDWAREHTELYQASGGTEGHIWDKLSAPGSYPCLLLTTMGRKSGEPRIAPLVYGRDGENYILIASQGGRPTHPAWYLNLRAEPRVQVQVADDIFRALAQSVSGGERQRLWRMMMTVYPKFDEYQAKVDGIREIPLIKLARH